MEDPQQHANWIAQAHSHWREHQPKRFKALQASGKLVQELRAAADLTASDMAEWTPMVARESAWEMVRERHLFPPEEPGNSPEAPASAGYLAMRELNEGWATLRMPGERDEPDESPNGNALSAPDCLSDNNPQA